MKKSIKMISSLALIFAVLLPCFNTFVFSEEISWYCKRNSEHKQPIADPILRIVEDYDGYYVDKAHGDDNDDKVVYLTFDAGYENGNVAKILDILKNEEVTGAFFVLEHLVKNDTELVKRMADEGHLVCNHTCSHKKMAGIGSLEEFAKELQGLEDIYLQYTGREMSKYYRPPEGVFDKESLAFAKELGYKTIFWSMAYADWDNNNQMPRDKAMKKLLDNIHNGAIILLHPTSATNVEILPEFIRTLKREGYRFGSLDELK